MCVCVCVCECMSAYACLQCTCMCGRLGIAYMYIYSVSVVHVPSISCVDQYNVHPSIPLMLSGEVIQHKYKEIHVICMCI